MIGFSQRLGLAPALRLLQPQSLVFAQTRFTRSFQKVVLMQDVPKLGFLGEICFVKPGRALNTLVPQRKAIFFSDPDSKKFMESVNQEELRKK
mmetsp:Transcript_1391/g.2450  ORF Transcript_1391/g.2450 Transcript_1391/m.2450 type:complete len:93 (-) Transcript_1391:346-624(-)